MPEPKVRFKRDDGSCYPEWAKQTVGEMTVELTDYKTLGCGLPLLTSSRIGLMFQDEYRGKTSTDNEDTLFSVVPRGAVTYRHMSDDDIFHFNINDLVDAGLVSKEYPVFNTVNGNNIRLLVEYLNSSNKFLEFCKAQKKGGTRTRLYFKVLKDFEIMFPCREEQQKIANFLSSVDEVIAASEQEVANLETQKKAVMKKVFSQEVRFKRVDGSDFPMWEEGCFGDLIEIYDERVTADCTLPVLTSSKQYGIQYQSDHFAKEQRHDITGYSVLPKGYCTYRNRSDGTDFTFNINNLCDKGIVSKFYPVFRATDRCVLYFLMTLLNNEPITVKKISITAKGTGQKVLSFLDLQKISISIPCLEEQCLIADFLSNFDEAITAAKKELELWKELKKGLLQQMFV